MTQQYEYKERLRAGLARQLMLLVSFVIIISLIAACGGGNDDAPPDGQVGDVTPAGGTALTCSQECADRGQCGESVDRGTVVLLNLEQPAVLADEHDLAVPAATAVNVVEERLVTVLETATGSEFEVPFYRVSIPDRNVEAWVAGWCVINP
ncbi:MAG: hypothetical protein ACOC9V_01975 [Chloroflexota bacterium]